VIVGAVGTAIGKFGDGMGVALAVERQLFAILRGAMRRATPDRQDSRPSPGGKAKCQ